MLFRPTRGLRSTKWASLIFLGHVAGVREGTIICAVSTGYIIGWFFKVCPLWDKVFAAVGTHPGGDDAENPA